MAPGQILDYSFEATKPVDFNIHFHEDSGISYPIEKKGVSSDHGSFTPQKKQFYCLMWTNFQHEFVTLTYTYGVRKEQK